MKKIILLPALLLMYSISFAQLSFNTGSAEYDQKLSAINKEAKLDLKVFKTNLNASHNLSIPMIDRLLKIMEPAEIIIAKDIADIVEKPIDDVVSSYKVNKDKGWGHIAKQMGIKPGSPEFHALKGKTKGNKGKGKPKKGNSKEKGNSGKGNSKGKGKK